MNLKDPRFEAIFHDHKFNIDPSDQSFKKTKAMETLLDEKIKRIQQPTAAPEEEDQQQQQKSADSSEISLLVKSIRSKSEVLKRKKQQQQKMLALTQKNPNKKLKY